MLKSGIWPKFHGKMGMKIGVNNTGTKLSFFWTQINQIWIKNASKTTYSYSARRDLSIGAWFDHIWIKKIFDYFWPKTKIWVICVQNRVFEVPEKSSPIFKPNFPWICGHANNENTYLCSLFIAESESFFQIEFRLFFYEIFKF